MTIYIVENYNTCEFEAFKELEQAATYVKRYYLNHMSELFEDCENNIELIFPELKADLDTLTANPPYIQDLMYIHEVTLHDSMSEVKENE